LYLDAEVDWVAHENQLCDESYWRTRLRTVTSLEERLQTVTSLEEEKAEHALTSEVTISEKLWGKRKRNTSDDPWLPLCNS
jgi:hypothetical protein